MTTAAGIRKYFIGIIPPSPVFEQVLEVKTFFRDHYQSKAALNSPPHITLHMPFEWKEKKEDELTSQLKKFSSTQLSFNLSLAGFSCFPPRVIFIEVQESEPLMQMQKQLHRFCKVELNLFNAQYQDRPFHPHLTVAFRDLKKTAFQQAWDEFKDKKFHTEFQVTDIVLLKHEGKKWQPFKVFWLA